MKSLSDQSPTVLFQYFPRMGDFLSIACRQMVPERDINSFF